VLVARKLDDPRQGSCPDLCRQAVRYASSSPAADLAGGPSEAQETEVFFPHSSCQKAYFKMNFILLKFIENFNKFQ
jgi:hypothetical protein